MEAIVCKSIREQTRGPEVWMGFGRNPYVLKAQAAEQKALDAPDEEARVRAYREAAHEWDRAAERETPGKKRAEYEENATRARSFAD